MTTRDVYLNAATASGFQLSHVSDALLAEAPEAYLLAAMRNEHAALRAEIERQNDA